MNDSRIEDIISSGAETKGLELLANRSTVGSLSATDQFSSEELERFWLNSKNIQDSNITGCESFPGEMLKPITKKVLLTKEMLSLMVDYYIATYENYNFKTPFGEGPEGSIIISVTINRFGRCRIGSEIFGSTTSFRHIKNSFILAKFITDNGVDCYPGQVQYFFKHTIDLPEGLVDHNLAYVRWYQHAETSKTRFRGLHLKPGIPETQTRTQTWIWVWAGHFFLKIHLDWVWAGKFLGKKFPGGSGF
jgi:hypothetical protein